MIVDNWFVDKKVLKNVLSEVQKFQLRNKNIKIFVGEFSTVRWAGGAAKWLEDCIEIFEEYGWDWVYHSWTSNNYFNLNYTNGSINSIPVLSDLTTDRKSVILKALNGKYSK